MKYRKKPVVIEAIQFNGENADEIIVWAHQGLSPQAQAKIIKNLGNTLKILTLEGDHLCIEGDFVIKGVKGEFYPCKPDIFEQTYDKVE